MTGAGSPDAYASSEKSGVGVSGGGLAGLGGAPGAAAGTGDSAANGTGRVRLSAGRGDVLPGAGDEPAAPHVGTLRNLPRELPTHLCEQVSAGAVAVSGAGLEAVRASLVWRMAELRADVRGAVLDAARMAAAALCVAGRPDGGGAVGSRGGLDRFLLGRRGGRRGRGAGGGGAVGSRGVLDRFLLGRRGGRRGRGAGGGCRAASSAASHRRGGGAGGTGCAGPGQQPAL